MKHLFLFLFSLMYVWAIHADSPLVQPTQSPSNDEYIELTPKSKNRDNDSHRHRAPARQNDVECYYLDGNLHINFEFPEGNAILNIYDMSGTKCLQQPFSTTTTFIYNIGDITEPVKIEIETESNVYEGFYLSLIHI